MDEIDETDEQKENADQENVAVVEVSAGVPRQGEDGAGDDDAEDFDQTVKKDIAVAFNQIQREKRCENAGVYEKTFLPGTVSRYLVALYNKKKYRRES